MKCSYRLWIEIPAQKKSNKKKLILKNIEHNLFVKVTNILINENKKKEIVVAIQMEIENIILPRDLYGYFIYNIKKHIHIHL